MPKKRTPILTRPGSDEAIKKGCLCSVLDNFHGKGADGGKGFWITANCPLHGVKLPEPQLPGYPISEAPFSIATSEEVIDVQDNGE